MTSMTLSSLNTIKNAINQKKRGDIIDDFTEKNHESYGMAGFYRLTSSHGHPLFGSSIKHRDTICLRIGTANVKRGLSTDWYHKKDITYHFLQDFTMK